MSNIVRSITALGDLPIGWNYGKGKPAPTATIQNAIRLAERAVQYGHNRLDCFPCVDGEITVAIYIGSDPIEDHSFQVDNDGEVRYWREDDPKSEFEDMTMDEALTKISTLLAPAQPGGAASPEAR